MKKNCIAGLILFGAGLAIANELAQIRVTGNRVSLREAPQLNAVLLGQVMEGDLLTLVDRSNAEWYGVLPPESVVFWVSSEFIRDNHVVPERLNVRSGPSLNHGIVGVLHGNDRVTIRGQKDDWLQIAPTTRTAAWISRKYSEVIGAIENEPVPLLHIEPSSKSRTEVVLQPNVVTEFVSQANDLSCDLMLNPDKLQGKQKHLTGILQQGGENLFKLVDIHMNDHTLCYVRGNLEQMNSLKGQPVAITGESFWVTSMNVPIIKPVKIQLLKR